MQDRDVVPGELTQHFVSDEADWLERVRQLDPAPETRQLFVEALQVAAAVEKPVTAGERAILTRVAQTLGVDEAALRPLPVPARTPRPAAPAQSAVATGAPRDDGGGATPAELAAGLTGPQRAGELAYALVLGVSGWATRAVQRLRTRSHVSTVTLDATG
jgi:hypothetical protein